MQGIAILINVFPSEVPHYLQKVGCFREVPLKDVVKTVYLRFQLRNEGVDKKKWQRDHDFVIVLLSWSGLTSAWAAQCEEVCGKGCGIDNGKSRVLWLANEALPDSLTSNAELHVVDFMKVAQAGLVDKVWVGLRQLYEGFHNKRRMNNVISQFDGARQGLVTASASSASQVPSDEMSEVGKWLLSGEVQNLSSTFTIQPGLGDESLDSKRAIVQLCDQLKNKAWEETRKTPGALLHAGNLWTGESKDVTSKIFLPRVRYPNPKESAKQRLVWIADVVALRELIDKI